MEIKVYADIPESRRFYDLYTDTWDWSQAAPMLLKQQSGLTDYWIDPITHTLMLRPLQFRADWARNTGIVIDGDTERDYRRLRKDAFVNPDDPQAQLQWDEVEIASSGDYWLVSRGQEAASAGIQTATTYPANQGFVVSLRNFRYESDSDRLVEIYFGGFKLVVWGSGLSVLYREGENDPKKKLIGGGYISDRFISSAQFSLLILPCKDTGILIYSSLGHGWFATVTEYQTREAETEASEMQQITAPGPLTVKFPVSQAYVQACHTLFPSYCEIEAPARPMPRKLRDPEVAAAYSLAHTLPGTGVAKNLVDATGGPITTQTSAYQLKYILISTQYGGAHGNSRTPFVYGAELRISRETQQYQEKILKEVTSDIVALSIATAATLEAKGTITFKFGEYYFNDAGGGPQNVCAVRVTADGEEIFYGFGTEPKMSDSPDPETRRLTYTLSGWVSHTSRMTILPSPIVLDGKKYADVFKYVTYGCGIDDNRVATHGYVDLSGSYSVSEEAGKYLKTIDYGASVTDIVQAIVEETGYVIMEAPVNGKWMLIIADPLYFSLPKLTYSKVTKETALPIMDWSYEKLPPICNELNVLFCDGTTYQNTLIRIKDEDAQNPLLPVDQRKPNWVGEVRRSIVYDERTMAFDTMLARAISRAARPGVMTELELCKFSSLYCPDINPLDTIIVESNDPDDQTAGIWQVFSVETDFERATPDSQYARCISTLTCYRDYRLVELYRRLTEEE